MRVLLSIFSINEQILHIQKALQSLGCEVEVLYTDSYRQICPYYMKKIDELGFHSGKQKYLASIRRKVDTLLQEFHPDIVLFINTPKDILAVEDVQHINQYAKTICWFVDGISDHPEIIDYLKVFHQIYVFEHGDVDYLNQLSLKGTYLPVGYNDAFRHVQQQEKQIDILFIGSPFHNRLQILEQVSMAACQNEWKLKIIGPFYDEKYPWKKMLFQKKYPYIYRYLENKRVSSEEAATLYAKTKICLNIHDTKHKSPNPRTFEILAVGSFELIDQRDYWGVLTPGKDIIAYSNIENLITNIEFYLDNESERNNIAHRGSECIKDRLKMNTLLTRIISSI